MERDLYWNSWELVHPFPIVAYCDGEATAHVRYGGREAILPADFRPVSTASRMSYERDRLTVNGFAARFPKGRRIWNSELEFVREDEETAWSFWQVYLFDGPASGAPPQIIGFLKDYPAKDRGLGGSGKKVKLRYRSRAGLPEGPMRADDFQDENVWRFAEALWTDEAKDPFETARTVGATFLTLCEKFGTPAKFARLCQDEGTNS